ncbi:hypothetical protein OOK58_43060 [Streptomyces sp. NBC_01728]|uniref:hypothetical protein n=1 Tax=unclassified Streptomyces TaxID=2593676 RepID=UPI00225B555E|nr:MULTISPECIES: hypothetical protein [unclassified Streptomyces]MCX4458693.1 hypothetical protein [Streptomyces sp. NBC_01719]MCX4498050.1 hypothetical protein [Streptomyces sp. NBC_01728]
MAMRGTPARRLVGNPIGGVLRNLDQRARIAGRTRTSGAPSEQDPVPQEPTRTTPSAAPGGPVAAVLETGEDGRATWTFPTTYSGRPAVTAVAVDPEPGDDERAVWATLEQVSAWCVVVRVWRSRPRRGAGVAEPAGPGLSVHLMAVPTSP